MTCLVAAARPDDVVLSLQGVSIASRITSKPVVQGVPFSLRRGRAIGIVGESGSGKTLTCRAILGILSDVFQISGGTIELDGRDVHTFSRKEWSEARGSVISGVFQDPASYLNPAMRVGKQIEEIFRVKRNVRRRSAKAEVLHLFESLHLRDPELVFEQYPQELSGGMVQRVLIASAVALAPAVLIADEATTALDVTVQAEILDLLVDLQRGTGLALVVVSHDLAVVAQLCDEVLVMKSGEVLESGPVDEILGRPRHSYTQSLVREHGTYGLGRFRATSEGEPLEHAS
jgi:ABC-type dipeptide/oligopeptide/nickel transport system ATPase component